MPGNVNDLTILECISTLRQAFLSVNFRRNNPHLSGGVCWLIINTYRLAVKACLGHHIQKLMILIHKFGIAALITSYIG